LHRSVGKEIYCLHEAKLRKTTLRKCEGVNDLRSAGEVSNHGYTRMNTDKENKADYRITKRTKSLCFLCLLLWRLTNRPAMVHTTLELLHAENRRS
jgi:hypothetical protein